MARGKRYTDKEKQEVIDFALAHDKKNGRGGKAAAAKKFGVNINSVLNWMSGSKKSKKKPGPKKASPVAKQSKSPAKRVQAKSGSEVEMLERMLQIQKQIEDLKSEYSDIKSNL